MTQSLLSVTALLCFSLESSPGCGNGGSFNICGSGWTKFIQLHLHQGTKKCFLFLFFLLLENEQVFLSSLSNYTKKSSLFGKANQVICVARGQNFHQQFSYALDLVLWFEEGGTVFSFFPFFSPWGFPAIQYRKFFQSHSLPWCPQLLLLNTKGFFCPGNST